MTGFYRRSVLVFGVVAIGLGIALLVETTVEGGGTIGYLLGLLFLALGIGRIFLVRRSTSGSVGAKPGRRGR